MKARFGDLLIAIGVGLAVFFALFTYQDALPDISPLFLAFAIMTCTIMILSGAIFLLVKYKRLSQALPVDRKSILLTFSVLIGIYLFDRFVGINWISGASEQEMAFLIIANLIFMVSALALAVVRVLNQPDSGQSQSV